MPITAPLLVDGFEGSWPPDGWLLQQLAPTGLWSPTTDAEMVHSGSVAAIHLWGYGEADSWLVTSLVTPTPSSQLEFWQYERYSNSPARHSVYISTEPQDPKYEGFVLLGEITLTQPAEYVGVRLTPEPGRLRRPTGVPGLPI